MASSTDSTQPAAVEMIYCGVDIEGIRRDPTDPRSLAAVGLHAMTSTGRRVASASFWLAFVAEDVAPDVQAEFFDDPKNEGLLESWLEASRKSFNSVMDELAKKDRYLFNVCLSGAKPSINNIAHRRFVNDYLRLKCHLFLRHLEANMRLDDGSSVLRYVGDYPEYDFAWLENWLWPVRQCSMAYQARCSESGEYTSSWVDVVINADKMYLAWIGDQPNRTYGFGSELAKRLCITLPPNENPHDPEADAKEIVEHWVILSNAMAPKLSGMWSA